MVTIPTKSEIKSQILTYIEAADTSTTLLPSSWWEVLASAMAGAIYLLYKFGLWLYYQIFTSSMDSDALTLRGKRGRRLSDGSDQMERNRNGNGRR